MQYVHDANSVSYIRAVNDDMRADRVREMRRWQVLPAVPKLRVLADCLKRSIKLVSVG
jgi:hypothetical protein